ncbi:hypothetical protein M422DRAFT_276628 [Sphaerobolus stellatus SS14]|uniref:Unplaced genomic scaffold SPHSTscaffold_818, whole genome shotgun sequence n=1 Tax=Sphaerobolus stellatus (strain SS14) TaxID=990650 RepID=A0A0C9U1K9_SPHS4|nr:hypothetical protein M422DRAFT_276628 [Sphaerobolus stellatus SS14]
MTGPQGQANSANVDQEDFDDMPGLANSDEEEEAPAPDTVEAEQWDIGCTLVKAFAFIKQVRMSPQARAYSVTMVQFSNRQTKV